MRVVLDPNVVISALLAPTGAPARVLRAWLLGEYELVVSAKLLAELERALVYPKIRARIGAAEAAELIELLSRLADERPDPTAPHAVRSPDPGDDYLIALAAETGALLVSGDRHLLGLAERIPVCSPAELVRRLAGSSIP